MKTAGAVTALAFQLSGVATLFIQAHTNIFQNTYTEHVTLRINEDNIGHYISLYQTQREFGLILIIPLIGTPQKNWFLKSILISWIPIIHFLEYPIDPADGSVIQII
jgi:hypothetical protein